MKFTQLETLLSDFGTTCGLDALSLDDRGLCRLVFDERFAIDIAAMEEPGAAAAFLLSAAIGRVGDDADPKLLRRFLAANLFVRKPNDAFVCLYPEREEAVILCRHDCSSMDAYGFEKALMDFLDQARSWTEYVAGGGIDDRSGPDVDGESVFTGGFVRA